MPDVFIFKDYPVAATTDRVLKSLDRFLGDHGYKTVSADGETTVYANPGIRFNSTRPMTCITRLSVRAKLRETGGSVVRIGVTFTKIKYFTIAALGFVVVLLPAGISYLQSGVPGVPPLSVIAIPLGVMVHYHVRWRVFRAIARLMDHIGKE